MKKSLRFAILATILLLFAQSSWAFIIQYPRARSLVLSDEVKLQIDYPTKRCREKPLKVRWGAQSLPIAAETRSGRAATFQIALPKNLPADFELEIEAEKCTTKKLKLSRFRGTPLELGEKIFESVTRGKKPSSFSYNWTTAVFFYGALKLESVAARRYIAQYFAEREKKGFPAITSPDLAAMALPAALLKSQEPLPILDQVIERTEKFFKNEPVNEIGALNHVGREHRFHALLPKTRTFVKDSIWVDSMMMYGLTGLELASSSAPDQTEFKKFISRQPLIFAERLQDPNGLFKHAYYLQSQKRFPAESYWARGNGWAAASLAEFSSVESEHQNSYKEILKKLMEGLSQTLNGPIMISKTLIHSEAADNYFETSGSALIAYAFAKAASLGIASEIFKEKARAMAVDSGGFIIKDKKGNLIVSGISRPTDSFQSDWYYTSFIRPGKNISYGVGAYLLMLSELHKQGLVF